MKAINACMAVPHLPPYIQVVNENGVETLAAIGPFLDYVNMVKASGIRLSYYAADPGPGVMNENGTYDGTTGAIQAQKADFSFLFVPLTIDGSPGKLGTVAQVYKSFAVTTYKEGRGRQTEIAECLNVFESDSLIYIAGTVLLLLSVITIRSGTFKPWHFFATLALHEMSIIDHPRFRLMAYLLFSYFLFTFYCTFSSAFTTGLTIPVPIKTIDTLKDLAQSSLIPKMYRYDVTVAEFKFGKDEYRKAIWKRALKIGLNKVFFDVMEFRRVGDEMHGGQCALIARENNIPIMTGFACEKHETIPKDEWTKLHMTETISEGLYGNLMNRDIQTELEQRLNNLSYHLIEHGLLKIIEYESALALFDKKPSVSCMETLLKKEESFQEPPTVSISDFRLILIVGCVVISIAFALFALSILRFKVSSNLRTGKDQFCSTCNRLQ